MAKIPVALLVEHPENKLFHNLSDEELQELAKDMQENGLIHAVVARTAGEQYQIISGHQRVRAAKLLGWTEIETDVLEVDENKAARMLISANVKTRTLSPMELAKAIRREKELIEQTYGERRGNPDLNSGHNVQNLKGVWSEEIAKENEINEKTVRRLDKLNELIPELQQLVDQGKLGTTAAEQLAYLESETQQALFASLGEEISLRTVAQTKELRKRLEEAQAKDRQTEELQQELARLQQMGRLEDKQQIARLQSEIQHLQNQPPEQIEVVPEAVKNELAVWKKRVSEVEQEKREKEDALRKKEEELAFFQSKREVLLKEIKRLEKELANAQAEKQEESTTQEKAQQAESDHKTQIRRVHALLEIATYAEIRELATNPALLEQTAQDLANFKHAFGETLETADHLALISHVLAQVADFLKRNARKLEVVK
ncbi:ParB/RepB/Spo0J family partition protein [Sulfoacidibacillus thermotolerans]|uniref:ParB-like N-terminal domain-containing protein n=1 Tax=Sulfoacidibacillus thermotolerans TaxID=1765684 RepID=A0A2U3D5M7_SULT2|nr:ParB/RepB/Spo0J family partition protein [Sulfoacidibacillus thermotolerans]PWI56582.1 hypothetical protein BM613_12980 [Sulfoacidibacillus thermotolerans]